MMVDINQSPVLWPHANKTNLHLNIFANLWSNKSPLQTHFDSLCTAIEAHKRRCNEKLGLSPLFK